MNLSPLLSLTQICSSEMIKHLCRAPCRALSSPSASSRSPVHRSTPTRGSSSPRCSSTRRPLAVSPQATPSTPSRLRLIRSRRCPAPSTPSKRARPTTSSTPGETFPHLLPDGARLIPIRCTLATIPASTTLQSTKKPILILSSWITFHHSELKRKARTDESFLYLYLLLSFPQFSFLNEVTNYLW